MISNLSIRIMLVFYWDVSALFLDIITLWEYILFLSDSVAIAQSFPVSAKLSWKYLVNNIIYICSKRKKKSRLFDVFRIIGYNVHQFSSRSLPFSPYWPKLLNIFIFPSLLRSFDQLFPVSWLLLDNCKGPLVTYEPCNVSSSLELLLSVFCDQVIHSTQFPN